LLHHDVKDAADNTPGVVHAEKVTNYIKEILNKKHKNSLILKFALPEVDLMAKLCWFELLGAQDHMTAGVLHVISRDIP
jgi:hypothetical protein